MRMLIMAMQMKCVPQVDTGQYAENIGLNERDAKFQSVYRYRECKGQPPDQQSAADRQAEQNREHHMTRRHIRE